MGIISLKCPTCGADLNLDDSQEFGFCSYCGTKVMQDKLIIEHRGNISIDGIANVKAYIERGFLFLEDADYKSASAYFEKALDADPRCSKAYLGKLACKLKVKDLSELETSVLKPLGKFPLFIKAKRFAQGKEAEEITRMEASVNERLNNKDSDFRSRIAEIEGRIAQLNQEMENSKSVERRSKSLRAVWIILLIVSALLSSIFFIIFMASIGDTNGAWIAFILSVLLFVGMVVMIILLTNTNKKLDRFKEIQLSIASEEESKAKLEKDYYSWKKSQETFSAF